MHRQPWWYVLPNVREKEESKKARESTKVTGLVFAKRPRPVNQVLQLLKGDEDEHRRGLQTHPRRHPSLEHEHRAFILHRAPDDLQSRLDRTERSANRTL